MLRGFATVSYYAADLEAAAAWYSEVLGIEPYFRRPGLPRVPRRRLPARARHHRRAVPPRRPDGARRRDHPVARRRPARHVPAPARPRRDDVPAADRARTRLRDGRGRRPLRQPARHHVQPALGRSARLRSTAGCGRGAHNAATPPTRLQRLDRRRAPSRASPSRRRTAAWSAARTAARSRCRRSRAASTASGTRPGARRPPRGSACRRSGEPGVDFAAGFTTSFAPTTSATSAVLNSGFTSPISFSDS